MAIVQQIKDGKVVGNTSSSSSSTSSTSSTDDTKNMFLQLLVAEMKYQDPLEPTDNTEYVNELATFTQVESLQDVQQNVAGITADQYVGKYVDITTDDGEKVTGKVDYVKHDGDTVYVSVNDKLYDASKVTSVSDTDYYEAVYAAKSFADMIAALPNATNFTTDYTNQVKTARTLLDSMSTYQKNFVSADDVAKLESLEALIPSSSSTSS